ncbi:MAG TPA: HEAT repeat domain-containing protein, partial [Longimicrobium sp.]|uniref:HEAT repeat domain-containing protein n=1 Tax=Longimicrobium sp. TaxID=2029185 RepID=UPI002ED8E88D
AAAVGMAGRSQLEGRVIAVLDGARTRGSVGARAALVCCALAAVALFPLAAASPSIQQPAAPEPAFVASAALTATPAPARAAARAGEAGTRVAAARPSAPARRRGPARAVPVGGAPAPAAAPVRVAASPELITGDEATIAALMRAARDVDPQVRRSAVWALGQMDDGLVVSPLLRSMSDRDARVRGTAAAAIGEYATRQRLTRAEVLSSCSGGECPVPTGTGSSIQQPRAGRSDLEPPRRDLGQRILAGLTAELDTLPSTGSPIGASPGSDM